MKGNLIIKKGNFYVVISYKNERGEIKKKWVATGLSEKGNKRAANEMMRKIVNDFEQATKENPPCPESELLFSDFLRNWLAMVKPNLQVSSYGTYQMQVQVIAKYFDKKRIKLKNLKPSDISTFYADSMADGKSIQVCEHYHVNIRKALQSAVRSDIIPSNPADKIDRPKSPKYLAKYYNAEQLKKLFDAIEGHKFEHIFKLTALYGLRRSEMLGLKWSAIDFSQKTLTINHSIVQTKLDGKPVIVAKDQMKNKSSLRTLPLVPFAEELLLREKQRQNERQELYDLGYDKRYTDYVCVNEIGQLLKPSTLSFSFKYILERAGLPIIRFHELRHSCASLLIENGFSMKQVQEWLGHSTYVTTADIYSHLDFSNKITVGKAIGELFSNEVKSTSTNIPKGTIIEDLWRNYIIDDDDEKIVGEYDSENDKVFDTTYESTEMTEETIGDSQDVESVQTAQNDEFRIEVSEQEYIEYLKWKKQLGKTQPEM
jgi:integrase